MSHHSMSIPFDDWLSKARAGNSDCLATLLDAYCNYLRLLARLQISRLVRVRVSPSDIAQESILRAKNAFGNFRGQTEPELLAWLRRVLASELALTVRFHSANRRDVNHNWTNGNFTGGGTDAADLNELALNWQQSVPAAAQAVPEPASMCLVLLALAGFALRARAA